MIDSCQNRIEDGCTGILNVQCSQVSEKTPQRHMNSEKAHLPEANHNSENAALLSLFRLLRSCWKTWWYPATWICEHSVKWV